MTRRRVRVRAARRGIVQRGHLEAAKARNVERLAIWLGLRPRRHSTASLHDAILALTESE